MKTTLGLTAAALAAASASHAQDVQEDNPWVASSAVTFDAFVSSDADDSETQKIGVGYDWQYGGPDKRLGVRIEQARFAPNGGPAEEEQRIYVRAADKAGDWNWSAMPGTNGDTLIGSASVHNNSRFRQEYFVERDRVETPQGLDQDLYYTFAGGAVDVPFTEHSSLTVMAGVQDFSGENVRTHLRMNYVQTVKPDWGLSVQLRTRYFENSEPQEYDYFSPDWYAEVMPVVQVRRFNDGWRYSAAVGYGAQKQAGGEWREARYLNASVISPPVGRDWAVRADVTYSDTPGVSGFAYDYFQAGLSVTRAF